MIQEDEDGMISVAGGKLTTYRLMAAEVMAMVAQRLKQDGTHVGGCHTGTVPLPGGSGLAFRGQELLVTTSARIPGFEEDAEQHLGHEVIEHLQESYGCNWVHLVTRASQSDQLSSRIVDDLPYLWAEVDHAVEEELAVTLRDFMRRRSQLEIRDHDLSQEVAPRICERMAFLLDWSTHTANQQLADFRQKAAQGMAWREEGELETIRAT